MFGVLCSTVDAGPVVKPAGSIYGEISRLEGDLLICKQSNSSYRIAERRSDGVHIGLPW